jgi:hypothetical protein
VKDWLSVAICRKDNHSDYWLSYDLDKIEYAKQGCAKCSVQKECAISSLSQDDNPVGVIAGLSEYDRLIIQWKGDDEQQWP